MKCPHCGAVNDDRFIICALCGRPVGSNQPDSGAQPYTPPQQPYNTPPQQPYGGQPYNAPLQQPYGDQPYNAPMQQPYGGQPYNTPPQQPYGGQPYNAPPQQPYGGQPYNTPPQQAYGGQQYAQRTPYQPPVSTKASNGGFNDAWHMFMAYGEYFLLAIGCVLLGIGNTVGWQYDSDVDVKALHKAFGSVETLDIVVGVIYILIGLFAFYIRTEFVAHKMGVSAVTQMTLGFLIVVIVFYYYDVIEKLHKTRPKGISILAKYEYPSYSEITDEYIPIVFPIILVAVLVMVMILNSQYFKSQKHLFVKK